MPRKKVVVDEGSSGGLPEARAADFAGKSDVGYSEMVRWAHDHLDIAAEDLSPADAPSAGAWGMLRWARGSRKEFYSLWQKLAAKGMEDGTDERVERELVEKVSGIAERLRRVHERAGLELELPA